MIDYTERITLLMRDIVQRVPALSYIDLDQVLVFVRYGAAGASGPYATCHCLTLPPSEPGYYFWLDASTGEMTRRSPYFVTCSPTVTVDGRPLQYLLSFALPRFCNQTLARSRKARVYPGAPPWVGKLDTIVHELYHIDPDHRGIRQAYRANGAEATNAHGRSFLSEVAEMVRLYRDSHPDEATYAFLASDFAELERLHGGVVGTTFRSFPSFPQRFPVPLAPQPAVPPGARIQPLIMPARRTVYTERDLVRRQFFASAPAPPRRLGDRVSRAAIRTQAFSEPIAVAVDRHRP